MGRYVRLYGPIPVGMACYPRRAAIGCDGRILAGIRGWWGR